MDSILWFHVECPRHAAAFDDPNTFKLKFRDFFSHLRASAQVLYETPEHMDRLRLEYDTNLNPDDVRLKPLVVDFMREGKEFNPARVVDLSEGDVDLYEGPFEEEVPREKRAYFAPEPAPTLTINDSLKFGGDARPYPNKL